MVQESLTEEDIADNDEEQLEMLKLTRPGGIDSTEDTKAPGNDVRGGECHSETEASTVHESKGRL